MTRDLFTTSVLALIAVSVLVGVWSVFTEERAFRPIAAARVPIDVRMVADRIIDSVVVQGRIGDTVRFAYVGDPVPGKLAVDEVPELRTNASYTRFIETVQPGDDPIIKLTTIVYAQKTFVQRPDGWYIIEFGEASKEQFEQAMRNASLLSHLINTAYAVDLYSGAGDGYVSKASTVSWADAHDATSGDKNDSAVSASIESFAETIVKTFTWLISRSFLPFDTSSIPANATISSATLNIYATGAANDQDDDGSDYLTVVQTSQATHTVLADADYDQCGAVSNPTEGIDSGQRKDLTDVTGAGYIAFTLNSTGRGWIAKSGQSSNCTATAGITCLGVREGHDTTNVVVASETTDGLTISTSEESGTTQDPYLAVTYSVPASASGLKVGADGSLKITGGGIKIR